MALDLVLCFAPKQVPLVSGFVFAEMGATRHLLGIWKSLRLGKIYISVLKHCELPLLTTLHSTN